MRRQFPFQFLDEDSELFLLSQMARTRFRTGGSPLGMFNLYLNYSTTTTVANSTTETALLGAPDVGSSKTLTPGLAVVGRTLQLFFSGILSCVLTPTLDVRLRLGGLTGALLEDYTPAVNANPTTAWYLNVYAVITAIGAGGAIAIQPGAFEFALGTQGAAQWSGRNTGGAAVDISSDKDFELSAQWGTANVANIFTYRFGMINVIR